MNQPLLKWTGHPLADVGVATLCAMVGKTDPTELTLEDLDKARNELQVAYTNPVMSVYLLSVFTKNSPYTNHTTGAEKRAHSIERLLRPSLTHQDPGSAGRLCVFSGEPATHLLERTQMPMLTGKGVLNFYPNGETALPVSAPYLLALQAVPLGGRRCEGRLLIVHCDQPKYCVAFAQGYLNDNRRLLSLATSNTLPSKRAPSEVLTRELEGGTDSQGRPQFADSKGPFTLVLDDLVALATQADSGDLANENVSITVYFMSNELRNPTLQIEHIPSTFVAFLQDLNAAGTSDGWTRLVNRHWPTFAGMKKGKTTVIRQFKAGQIRNRLYQDLFDIFRHGFIDSQAGARFVSRYFLGVRRRAMQKQGRKDSPIPISRLVVEHVDWPLTSLFIKKVMGMDKARIERIKEFADRLATAIHDKSDRSLLSAILYSEDQFRFHRALTSAQVRYQRRHSQLLFGLDDFVQVFLAEDAIGVCPWYLVRDLISIRVMEQLARKQREQDPTEYPLFAEIDEPDDNSGDASDLDEEAVDLN